MFNRFAETTWAHDGVEPLALALQRQRQLEPNLLLLALWLQQQQRFLESGEFEHLIAAQLGWTETMVRPYRRLRVLAKGALPDADYRQMLKVELAMERRSQQLLMSALESMTFEANGDNLQALLQASQIEFAGLAAATQMELQQLFAA